MPRREPESNRCEHSRCQGSREKGCAASRQKKTGQKRILCSPGRRPGKARQTRQLAIGAKIVFLRRPDPWLVVHSDPSSAPGLTGAPPTTRAAEALGPIGTRRSQRRQATVWRNNQSANAGCRFLILFSTTCHHTTPPHHPAPACFSEGGKNLDGLVAQKGGQAANLGHVFLSLPFRPPAPPFRSSSLSLLQGAHDQRRWSQPIKPALGARLRSGA